MVVDNERGDRMKHQHDILIRDGVSVKVEDHAMSIPPPAQTRDGSGDQLDYWKQCLPGASMILELPTDRPHPSMQTFDGRQHAFVLPRSLTTALKMLNQDEEASLFVPLLAAFRTLLHRYTGQDDFLIGTPIIQHGPASATATPDLFAHLLALRTVASDNPTFRDLLRRTRQTVREAKAHQEVSFEQMVQALEYEPEPGRHPLFQVMFVLEQLSLQARDEGERGPYLLLQNNEAVRCDLTLWLQETEQRLKGWIVYDHTLFDTTTIERLIGHWQSLLEGIVANPEQHIADLPLLTGAEWQQQMVEWNATVTEYPSDRCLHDLFEAQVARTPDAVAVRFKEQQVTYRELNRQVNQLAHQLSQSGVGPETLGALLLDRGISFIVSILAVFKAGGAFLPLDPDHPVQRHRQILQQSGCPFVLTEEKFRESLAETIAGIEGDQRPQMVVVEECADKEREQANLPGRSQPGNLAYVMYTSGSTGIPKGVMVEQVGMVNHIYGKIADLGISGADRVAQNGPPCFDIVVWQCLAPLLVGGCVQVFDDEIAHDPAQLLEHLESDNITVLQAVPSILRAVVQQAEVMGEHRPGLSNLRWVVPTGDALPPELCRKWLRLYPTIPLLNTYGSTECSDDQCHHVIAQPPPLDYPLAIMSIGRPIQNMRTYILDQRLQPVPIGVVGDLYIGGIGVGRGYLHDAERTAEVFLPDPFASEPGRRLYKTRDQARYLADGSIEFLGRTDHLVKIHGVRIEPGEIEAALEQHPAIREAVVIARETEGGNKYLAAYIVPIQGQTPGTEEMRSWLGEKLPEYMVPGAFMLLDDMPLNSNGKVDRRALPLPQQSASAGEHFVPPTLPAHHQLITIWEELLEARPIGIRDNFFDLGGHSLLAVSLINSIEQVWGKKIPAATLLAGPTIEQLAHILVQPEEISGVPEPGEVQTGKSRPSSFSARRPLLSSLKARWTKSRSSDRVKKTGMPASSGE